MTEPSHGWETQQERVHRSNLAHVVQDLAKIDEPILWVENRDAKSQCVLCNATASMLQEPVHKETCPWLRSRMLMESIAR